MNLTYFLVSQIFILVIIYALVYHHFKVKMNDHQLKILTAVTNAKDQYTVSHSEHVAVVCGLIFDQLPKTLQKKINKNRLIKAARLHDIGKLYIPDTILRKPAPLTDGEFEEIKTHPSIGAKLLSRTHNSDVSALVNWHHERADGNGYNKAPANMIPIESSIIAIADTFSALTTSRPYRTVPKTIPEAIDIIRGLSGEQLNEVLVKYFLEIDVQKLVTIDTMLKGQYFYEK